MPCERCGKSFFAAHGNQALCGGCKSGRTMGFRQGLQPTFGARQCVRCWREYTAVTPNQRYCSRRCKQAVRVHQDDLKYRNSLHRGRRARWVPLVASGLVRCARGAACRRSELVDGELLGGFIEPTERSHLGHPDGESVGGPEHVVCNTGAPSRLRARAKLGR